MQHRPLSRGVAADVPGEDGESPMPEQGEKPVWSKFAIVMRGTRKSVRLITSSWGKLSVPTGGTVSVAINMWGSLVKEVLDLAVSQ